MYAYLHCVMCTVYYTFPITWYWSTVLGVFIKSYGHASYGVRKPGKDLMKNVV